MSYHYLLDLALILLSTKLLGIATGKFQMPRVVGALLAGLILGLAALNILSETAFLTQLSELGVIAILFTAGMGTDLRELRSAGKVGFLVALCGVLVPMFMGTGFGWLAGSGSSLLPVLLKIVLFFAFAVATAYGGIRLFRRIISAHQKNLRRYPVFAFVLCLLLAYCAEELFGVADIIGVA